MPKLQSHSTVIQLLYVAFAFDIERNKMVFIMMHSSIIINFENFSLASSMVAKLHEHGHLTSRTPRPQQSHSRKESRSGVAPKHVLLRCKTKSAEILMIFHALSL